MRAFHATLNGHERAQRTHREEGLLGQQGQCGTGIGFGVLGVGEPQHVAGIFEQGMLKPSAGAQEGHALLAREPDRP